MKCQELKQWKFTVAGLWRLEAELEAAACEGGSLPASPLASGVLLSDFGGP